MAVCWAGVMVLMAGGGGVVVVFFPAARNASAGQPETPLPVNGERGGALIEVNPTAINVEGGSAVSLRQACEQLAQFLSGTLRELGFKFLPVPEPRAMSGASEEDVMA